MCASPLARLSARIGRWPRRVAALACLLLAAASALAPTPAPATGHRSGLGLATGEVAVPLTVVTPASLIAAGDRVGVIVADDPLAGGAAPAGLIADRLRVLEVHTDDQALSSGPGTVVVVAARRTEAVVIARFSTERLVLIVDELP